MPPINLDIRTLSFISTSIAIIFAFGLFFFGIAQKEFKGFSLLAFADALFAVGPFLIGYRDVLPDFITIILANVLNIVGIVLFYEGTCRFLERSDRIHPISIITVITGIALFFYFTYSSPSVSSRIISYTTINVIVSFLCARELGRDLHVSWRLPGLSTAFVFAVYGLYQLFRLGWTLSENPVLSLMSAGNVHALAFIANIFLIAGSTFGFVWMVNSRLVYSLTELATHDPLTNALNRRGLEILVSREFSELKRSMTDLSAVMLDIDDFKYVNDRFGHSAGDKVLMDFAVLIQKALRAHDIFGRTGGEEFFIVLPNTCIDQALTLAERFRNLIEEHEFVVDGNVIRVTASFGVSNCLPGDLRLDNLMLFTDTALLQSKQNGKNRVSLFTHPIE